VCQQGVKLLPCADWKKVCFDNTNQEHKCESSSYLKTFDAPLFEKNETHIMRKCHHNEVVGMHNRYLKEADFNITYDEELFSACVDELIGQLKPHFNGKISLAEFMGSKSGKLKTRYDKCVEHVAKKGFDINKDSNISAFIKHEIYPDETKPPRFIMGRNPIFNLIYGLYTTPLEHAMTHLPQIAKGKNFLERGEQFRDLIFGGSYVENDFSKYESTQQLKLLEDVELRVWKALLQPEEFETMRRLFAHKVLKSGYTMLGCKFKFIACRGSGDMDTGLFNTLINWVACRYFEIKNQLGHGNFMVDGDDGVIQTLRPDMVLINTFSEFGLDAKLILKHDYHDVDFCSSKFVQYRPGQFIQMQNIRKVLANMSIMKALDFRHCIGDYYYSLGFMYSKIYPNFPIFTQFSKFLMDQKVNFGKHGKHRFYSPDIAKQHMHDYDHKIIDQDIPLDYYGILVEYIMCFDLTYSEIDNITSYFSGHHMEIPPDHDKKFKKFGFNIYRHTNVEYDFCEQLMLETTNASAGSHISYKPIYKLSAEYQQA
jgi:hypothetical protein